MDRDFWLARWRDGQIGFHQPDFDPTLERLWPRMGVPAGGQVFVPLCGKSLDMRFLESQGHPVLGVELSPVAVEAYFAEAGEEPVVEKVGQGRLYRGPRTSIHCADVLSLRPSDLAEVRGVYDRAALIALPPPIRARYVAHLREVLPARRVALLLLTIEYDQAAVDGPPFSVGTDEIATLYEGAGIELLDEREAKALPPKFEGTRALARAHRVELG